MAGPKAPWHRGDYHRRSLALVAAAYRDASTTCARCGRTLAQHPPTKKTRRPPRWSAGHVNDSEVGGALRPEVISCGSSAGIKLRNARNAHTSSAW